MKPKHLQSLEVFYNLLQGMVSSSVSNHSRHQEAQLGHEPLGSEETGEFELRDPSDARRLVFIRDQLKVLLPRLFEEFRDQPRQEAIVRSWAAALEQGDLPDREGHCRHDVLVVRRKAQKILRELAGEMNLTAPSGREMLL